MKKFSPIFLLLLILFCVNSFADNTYDERRAQVGVRLFRSLVAADLDLAKKLTPDGEVLLYFLHKDDADAAGSVEVMLDDGNRLVIRKLPVVTRTVALTELHPDTTQTSVPAGVFITQRLRNRDLQTIIDYGMEHGVIVYSAFEGDVERGVLAGVSIQARIEPYLNRNTLENSNLNIKAFFLKVARQYE